MREPALIWTGKVMLDGRISMPPDPVAVAVFASAPALANEERDTRIVTGLFDLQIATIYTPLLTEDEVQFDARTTHFRYDAEFLAQRFIDIAQWTLRNRGLTSLPLGYIASSGAAAGALVAASQRPDLVSTVVSIDGRTDLAADSLRTLKTPTLLVVQDMPVLRMNREALAKIRGERRIEIVHDGIDSVVQKTLHWMQDKLALVAA
jgi:hypothetical protein